MKILLIEGILFLKGFKIDNYVGEIIFWLFLFGKIDDFSLLWNLLFIFVI